MQTDLNTADIVEPDFDRPTDVQSASDAISIGSRVNLIYQGNALTVQVEAIERLGTSFVGRIRDLSQGSDALPLVRFRPRDVAAVM